jgi:hypothetical protein
MARRYFNILSKWSQIHVIFITYRGKYHHGVKIYGTFDFNNGYVYTGGFLGDKFNGEGTITIPSGKTVKGDWKDN